MWLLPFPVGHLSLRVTAVPSVQPYYRAFIPTTDCSVPVLHIGTLALGGISHLSFSLSIGATGSRVPQKSLIWIHATSKPDATWAGLQGSAQTRVPGATTFPPVSTSSCEFRHVISGSLALVSPDLT